MPYNNDGWTRGFFGQAGFTFLEVLVALAVLSGVVVTVLTVMTSHIDASQRLKESSMAAMAAREKVEEIRLFGVPAVKEGELAGMPGYRWSCRAEPSAMGLEKVSIEVSWAKGKTGLTTLIPGKGPS